MNYTRLYNSSGFWALLAADAAAQLPRLRGGSADRLSARLLCRPRACAGTRRLFVVLIVIPLWISLLMRIFAWRLILGQSGLLNSFLVSSGILDRPSEAFLYTPASVILVFAYISIPFIFISCLDRLREDTAGPDRSFAGCRRLLVPDLPARGAGRCAARPRHRLLAGLPRHRRGLCDAVHGRRHRRHHHRRGDLLAVRHGEQLALWLGPRRRADPQRRRDRRRGDVAVPHAWHPAGR